MTADGTAGGDRVGRLALRDDLSPVEHRVHDDGRWHFVLALPPAAKLVPQPAVVPSVEAPTQSLGSFRRREPEAEVEVIGHWLEYEVDPHDWLTRALAADGRRVRSQKPQQLLSGAMGDVVATWELDGEAFAGRYVATKWGPRLFVVCGRTRLADYPELADELFRVAASFEALDDSLGTFAEHVHFFFEEVPFAWKAAVPDSWSIQVHPPAEDGAWFEAHHAAPAPPDEVTGEVDGRLSVAVMARSAASRPRDAGNTLLRALRDNDVELEHADFEEDERLLPVCRSRFEQAWTLTTPIRRGGARGELCCRVLMHARAWVVVGALGPSRDDDDDAWMRNKRVVDLVSSTLELEP